MLKDLFLCFVCLFLFPDKELLELLLNLLNLKHMTLSPLGFGWFITYTNFKIIYIMK